MNKTTRHAVIAFLAALLLAPVAAPMTFQSLENCGDGLK
jgi:hypothetical protein